ncbi:hypothetical protein X747_31930 [Mesorhizobium sp. LNJC384A00]|uniref:GNAT family N-acetyltransferase n=1 Tax=Mesorhizobium sp. LNJC384A00 TaxID=1287268 RepID=UPI0003CEF68A|nr:GNAT family N-acetyltransferase [Mesorhizobium sp. LNJC384A00]ESY30757.1 hypothetical protein X747_31930 [Mesorhizobium sp. LNJC384A00]
MTADEAIVPHGPEVEITMTTMELQRANGPASGDERGNSHLLLPLTQPPLHFYRYLIDRIGRQWHWQDYLCLSDPDLSARIHAPQRDMRLLLIDGAPAGLFDLDSEGDDTAEIVYLGLMAHAAGRGLGKWLLSEAIATAFSTGARRVVLKTCSLDHPAALAIYRKAGFEIVQNVVLHIRLLTLEQRAAILLR